MLAAALLAAAAPATAQPGGLPPCNSAPCAEDSSPPVILAYYNGATWGRLVRAVKHSGLPVGIPIYYGNYWGAGKPSRKKPRHHRRPAVMPNRRFAPLLPIKWSVFWRGRSVGPHFRRQLARAHENAMAGRLPPLRSLLHRAGSFRRRAGLELGRRFRDRIRAKRLGGQRIVSWQFDEVPNEALGSGALRQFIAGLLEGVSEGRPSLGDTHLPGIVYLAEPALRIRDGGFWRAVDGASLYVVGEEYPDFVGAPGRAAAHARSLESGLPPSLRQKYVAGATPGFHPVPSLGGNVRHRGRGAVERWRVGYLVERARSGVRGFAMFNFFERNGAAMIMNDALRALARAVRVAA